jgi:hypothetical protein
VEAQFWRGDQLHEAQLTFGGRRPPMFLWMAKASPNSCARSQIALY